MSSKWQFHVTRYHWSGYDVECLLRRYGIAITGRKTAHEADPPYVTFWVDKSKANFAEYIMCRAGITMLNGMFNPNNKKFMPKQRGSVLPGGGGGIRRDIMTRITDIIAFIMGAKVGTSYERHSLPIERRKQVFRFLKSKKHGTSYPRRIIRDFLS